MIESILKDWDNFYVITGSSAAGLTGLTFVVIALSADAKRVNPRGLRAYVTPTIVHFGSVLALACFMSMPHQTPHALCAGFGVAGVMGVSYAAFVARGIRHLSKDYVPVAEDWIFNVMLPLAAYGTMLASAFCIFQHAVESLYAVAAVSVALMFIGIHNAWDIAVFNTLRPIAGDASTDRDHPAG